MYNMQNKHTHVFHDTAHASELENVNATIFQD